MKSRDHLTSCVLQEHYENGELASALEISLGTRYGGGLSLGS